MLAQLQLQSQHAMMLRCNAAEWRHQLRDAFKGTCLRRYRHRFGLGYGATVFNMEQMHKENTLNVPTVEELVARIKYTKNYLRLKKEVGDYRIAKGLAMMRAAGLELRNAQTGGSGALSEMSRYSRIEPRLR